MTAVLGKRETSFDADGKLRSYTATLTSPGLSAFIAQDPNHPDPELLKARLAVVQREALNARGRQPAGPGTVPSEFRDGMRLRLVWTATC